MRSTLVPNHRPVVDVLVSASPSGGWRNTCTASDSESSPSPLASLPVTVMRRVTRSTRITPSTTHRFSTPMSTCLGSIRSAHPGARNAPVRFTTHTAGLPPAPVSSAASHVPESSPNCRLITVAPAGSATGPYPLVSFRYSPALPWSGAHQYRTRTPAPSTSSATASA
jgi:hypothetical protein